MAWSLIEQIEHHEGLITIPQAAKLTGFSRKKVYDMIKRGEIPLAILGAETEAKRIDPKTWSFVLQKRNPMMREAHRRS